MLKHEWNIDQIRQLVDALLACKTMQDKDLRDQVIEQLPQHIQHKLKD